jgi:heat shock protein HslJ
MNTKTPLLVLLALALFAVSCAEERPLGGDDPFGATTWQLISGSADGVALVLVDGAPVTFRADQGDAGGRSACNSYGGPISITDVVVTIGPSLQMTEMACLEDGVMDLEAAYLAALPRVTTVARDGEELVLRGDAVELRFVAQPEELAASLTGTSWVLDTIVQGETASTPAAEATLLIDDDGAVIGSTGCNQMNGTYDATSGFTQLATTKMACRGEIMAQEALVVEILESHPTLTIAGSQLTIADLDGRALVYRAG